MADTQTRRPELHDADLVAKVTGKAKYAEDYRVEGMLFAKLLLSPMPHARSRSSTRARRSRCPASRRSSPPTTCRAPPRARRSAKTSRRRAQAERGLTNEPLYQGEPILAVAAVDEMTAAEAIEAIVIEFEPLPFVVDPIESLRPGGPNARAQGNVWMRPTAPPAAAARGRRRRWRSGACRRRGTAAGRPSGGRGGPRRASRHVGGAAAGVQWRSAGRGRGGAPAAASTADRGLEVDRRRLRERAATASCRWARRPTSGRSATSRRRFKKADLVLDETFVTQSTGHQPLETRTAMAYWQNGKLYLHGSTQSTVQTVASVARWVGITADKVVLISEYTGGGFGSKIPGAISMAIPALLSKKANAPVMMRITREEEHYIGRARPGILARVKVGFRKDGRITALDLFTICDNGPYDAQGDCRSAGTIVSLAYQPETMRWRGLTVLTNTPPKTSQRAPGGMQGIGIIEPIIAKAAQEARPRSGRAPQDQRAGRQGAVRARAAATASRPTSRARSSRKRSTRAASSSSGTRRRRRQRQDAGHQGARHRRRRQPVLRRLDRLRRPVHHQAGRQRAVPVGHRQPRHALGRSTCIASAAEMLGMPWEQCDVVFGNTGEEPAVDLRLGRQPDDARDDARGARGGDRRDQEAAGDRGQGARRQSRRATRWRAARVLGPGGSMTFAQAAQKAIELGGKFDGHELPEDINAFTKTSAKALAGQGLMAVAKDNYPRDGTVAVLRRRLRGSRSGRRDRALSRCSTTRRSATSAPCSTRAACRARSSAARCSASATRMTQKWVYDQHYGVALARRFHHNKPPTILDMPQQVHRRRGRHLPDPETPVGARGVGEPPVGAGYGAVMNAIADALGDEIFRRSPVTPDMILTRSRTAATDARGAHGAHLSDADGGD